MNKKYAKKRVQLAKDVLAQLAEGKILPTNAGRYAHRSRAGQCEVCALGALRSRQNRARPIAGASRNGKQDA